MIWKEPLLEKDIQTFLKSYISAKIFSLRTGLYMVSMVCLLMTITGAIAVPVLKNNMSSFKEVVIILLCCIASIVVPIAWGLKSEKFKIVFEITTIPVAFIISLFCQGEYLLIINSVLLLVLIIVFIYKYFDYLNYKNELTTKNEKIFFEGVLTKCYKEDISISVRYSNIHTVFAVQDESETVSFSLAPLKILQLRDAGYNLPLENKIGKLVIVSFLSSMPNTLLSFKYA